MFGQRNTFFENLFMAGPILISVIVGILFSLIRTFERASYTVLLIGLVGVFFIFLAKWPAIKSGKFMTFGPREMNASDRKKYFIGYSLLGISLVGGIGLLIATQ